MPRQPDPSSSSEDVSCYYGAFRAVSDVDIQVRPSNEITALIGPSGCGKCTLLRCFNRMNDLIPGCRMEGRSSFDGRTSIGPDVDPVALRRRIGMVFQKPNPFPKSIYENVAWGPAINGYQGRHGRAGRASRSGAPRSGTRSRTSSSSPGWRSPAASSSGSASPGPWPSSPRSSSWTSPARRSTRSSTAQSRT